MTAPAFAREGCRLGGLTASQISAVGRTDSNGQRLYLDVYRDPDRTRLVSSSSAGTLNSGNNYQATVTVTGLEANRRYWYRLRADDGSTGTTNGTEAGFTAGKFTTMPSAATRRRLAFMTCNPINPYRYDALIAQKMWSRMASLGIHHGFHLGDIYYSDIDTNNATADYTSGAWRKPANDAAATLSAYRTNIISTYAQMGDRGHYNWVAQFMANTPFGFMWDDHDRGWDDMSGVDTWSAGQITRAGYAKQAGHEAFMNLNAIHITSDSRAWSPNSTEADYFHVDYPGLRIIVLNCRTFRDLSSGTDDANKSMLGDTQLAWALDKISSNPHDRLILASPVMFDGNHGWNESTTDGWHGFTHERDVILEAIWASGKADKTLIYSGDTHAGAVAKYTDGGTQTPIYEIAAGNLWPASAHGFVNGWKTGATGTGGDHLVMRVNEPNCCLVDLYGDGSMRAQLYELVSGKTIWSIDI